jgi:actin-related protein
MYTIQTVRLNVGGKLLSNYMKEILSYRQLNLMDEFELVTQVSQDASHELYQQTAIMFLNTMLQNSCFMILHKLTAVKVHNVTVFQSY